jgi:hypothetical protein
LPNSEEQAHESAFCTDGGLPFTLESNWLGLGLALWIKGEFSLLQTIVRM